MSSRLLRTRSGRAVGVEITTPVPGAAAGLLFLVLGDEIRDTEIGFTGEPTGRPPLLEETTGSRRDVGVERVGRLWTDAERDRARELQAAGLSWARIAEEVCGDKRFKPTVGGWLRRDATSTPQRPPDGQDGTLVAMRPDGVQP